MADDVVLNKVAGSERCLQRVVGFRTLVVHQYASLSRPILVSIVRERLVDFEDLCRAVLRAAG